MRIRRSTSKDIRAIRRLDHIAHTDRQRQLFIAKALREKAVYVLEGERGSICGYSILRPNFLQRYFLEMLFIGEDHRGKGLGDELIAHAESIAMKMGELWTSTNMSNLPMRRLLRKRGFHLAGRVSGLDECDPEVFYVKKKAEQGGAPNAHPRHASCLSLRSGTSRATGERG